MDDTVGKREAVDEIEAAVVGRLTESLTRLLGADSTKLVLPLSKVIVPVPVAFGATVFGVSGAF